MGRQRPGLADGLPHEPHRAFGSSAVAPPQDRVHEALPQTRRLVAALGTEAGDDGVVHLAVVVPVPGPAGLIAMHFDGQRVDVQSTVRYLAPTAGGLLMARHPDGQGFVDRAPLDFAGEAVDQPPIGRLTGQAFLEHSLAGAIPHGQLHAHVVGQRVLVVLMGVTQGQAVEVLAEQLDLLVPDSLRVARIIKTGR